MLKKEPTVGSMVVLVESSPVWPLIGLHGQAPRSSGAGAQLGLVCYSRAGNEITACVLCCLLSPGNLTTGHVTMVTVHLVGYLIHGGPACA